MENLMDGLLSQIDRNNELLQEYKSIGPSGQFGAMFIKQSLDLARESIAEGDAVKMLEAYSKLKDHK